MWSESRRVKRSVTFRSALAKLPARSSQVLPVHTDGRDDEHVPFPSSHGFAHPGIRRRFGFVIHEDHPIRGGKRVNHQHVSGTLENLERHVVIGDARNTQDEALGLGVGRGPKRAILVALFKRRGQVGDLSIAGNDAFPGRNRRDRTQAPEVVESLARDALPGSSRRCSTPARCR